MSYPGVDPSDAEQTSPVVTQERSEGVVTVELPETPTPAPILEAQTPNGGNHEPSEELKEQVKQTVEDLFAVTPAWQPKQVVKFVVECPSGQRALAKHLDTMDLIQYDLLEDLDFFTKKLFPEALDAQGNPVEADKPENIFAALKDPEKRQRFLDMTGRLMAAASVRPKIVHDGVAVVTDENGDKTIVFGYELDVDSQIKHFGKPIPPLKEGQAYSGPIDFADRIAFFSELNKPLGMIEPFREESTALLENLEPSKRAESTA